MLYMLLLKYQALGVRTRVRTCFSSSRAKDYDASPQMPAAPPYKKPFAEIAAAPMYHTAAVNPPHQIYCL